MMSNGPLPSRRPIAEPTALVLYGFSAERLREDRYLRMILRVLQDAARENSSLALLFDIDSVPQAE